MPRKAITVVISKKIVDVLNFGDFQKFKSVKYSMHDITYPHGVEDMDMNQFTGDSYFTSRPDLLEFCGLGRDCYEFDKLDECGFAWVKDFRKFNQADKEKWEKLAKDTGGQVRFRKPFGCEWEDFYY